MDRHSNKLQMQDFASPTDICPEGRYQKLKKDIDRDLDSQKTWEEFVAVCLSLGRVGEAARALPQVEDLRLRKHFQGQLEEQGIVLAGDEQKRPQSPAGPDHRQESKARAVSTPAPARLGAQPVQAGGSGARRRFQSEMHQVARRVRVSRGVQRESVWDECKDAIEYLLLDAMPVRILALTLLFPSAVAMGFLLPLFVGGILTSVLQYVPVFIALGLFLGYAQRIMLHSAGGEEDPPDLFEAPLTMLSTGLGGFLRAGVLSVLFIGPLILSMTLGLPIGLQIVLGVAGLAYMPMAILGVTILNNWEAITPRVVGRGIAVDLRGYLRLAFIFALAMSLPAIGIVLSLGSTLALAAAVVGPLLLAPGLATSRLFGRYFYAREQSMRRAMGLYRTLDDQSGQQFGETSRRRGLRRHDEKRMANASQHRQQGVETPHQRVVEANAPRQDSISTRGPVVAGPNSPILQHQRTAASRKATPQRRAPTHASPQQRNSAGRLSKLGNHSHRPLRKK